MYLIFYILNLRTYAFLIILYTFYSIYETLMHDPILHHRPCEILGACRAPQINYEYSWYAIDTLILTENEESEVI
jgi:hypothetical protein